MKKLKKQEKHEKPEKLEKTLDFSSVKLEDVAPKLEEINEFQQPRPLMNPFIPYFFGNSLYNVFNTFGLMQTTLKY